MKKSNIALLSALLVCSVAGAGTAAGFLVQGANQSTGGQADSAIILNWGETSTLQNVTSLTPSTPVYQEFTVAAPLSTSSVDLVPTLTATLTEDTDTEDINYSISGLHIDIATSTWLVEAGSEAPTPVISLGNDDAPETAATNNVTGTYRVTAAQTFYVRISVDATCYESYYVARDAGEYTLGGTLTLSYTGVESVEEGA